MLPRNEVAFLSVGGYKKLSFHNVSFSKQLAIKSYWTHSQTKTQHWVPVDHLSGGFSNSGNFLEAQDEK